MRHLTPTPSSSLRTRRLPRCGTGRWTIMALCGRHPLEPAGVPAGCPSWCPKGEIGYPLWCPLGCRWGNRHVVVKRPHTGPDGDPAGGSRA